jgi:hypothetical protein
MSAYLSIQYDRMSEHSAKGMRMGSPLEYIIVMNTVFSTVGMRVDSRNVAGAYICARRTSTPSVPK